MDLHSQERHQALDAKPGSILGTLAPTDEAGISIVIPSYGDPQTTLQCLRSLKAHLAPVLSEIVVVHSGPQDFPPNWPEHDIPEITLLQPGRRMFAGDARNFGARHCRGELLVFIDADCTVQPGLLETYWRAWREGTPLACGPVHLANPDAPFAMAEYLIEFAVTRKPPPHRPPSSAPSCNFAISRTLFEHIGGFPTLRFGHDVMLNLRLVRQGYKLRPLEQAVVAHHCRDQADEFHTHRRRIGGGLGTLTHAAEQEGLFGRPLSWEYQFLRLICRSPWGVLLIPAKFFRIASLIARGDFALLKYLMNSFGPTWTGLWTEARACRDAYLAAQQSQDA